MSSLGTPAGPGIDCGGGFDRTLGGGARRLGGGGGADARAAGLPEIDGARGPDGGGGANEGARGADDGPLEGAPEADPAGAFEEGLGAAGGGRVLILAAAGGGGADVAPGAEGRMLGGGGGGARLPRLTGAESCARLGGGIVVPGTETRGWVRLGGGGGAFEVGVLTTIPESEGSADSVFLPRESKMSRPDPFGSLMMRHLGE